IRLADLPSEPDARRLANTSGGRSPAMFSVFASATRTSPLGSTYSHRGLSRPSANAVTTKPAGAIGVFPAGQPMTFENLVIEGEGAGRCCVATTALSSRRPTPASTETIRGLFCSAVIADLLT